MTCFPSVETHENNCIQIIQADFSKIYYKAFNRSLELRLIYSYTDVSIIASLTSP